MVIPTVASVNDELNSLVDLLDAQKVKLDDLLDAMKTANKLMVMDDPDYGLIITTFIKAGVPYGFLKMEKSAKEVCRVMQSASNVYDNISSKMQGTMDDIAYKHDVLRRVRMEEDEDGKNDHATEDEGQ